MPNEATSNGNSTEKENPTKPLANKRLVCDQCPRTFNKYERLVEHKSTLHSDGEQSPNAKANHRRKKRFACDQCSNAFYTDVRLTEHKYLHTGEKPFSCDECFKRFRKLGRLIDHKRRHSKKTKFKCEICKLGCVTRQDFILHMRHHNKDRRFPCPTCPKAFVRSSDLKTHLRVHTGEKPYVCDICNKCFRANQNLIVHKKTHMGDASKTYKCQHCEKKFLRNSDLKIHMRSHTGEKPFKCELCDRGYSSKVNVKAHMERDHIPEEEGDEGGQMRSKRGPKRNNWKDEVAKQKKLIEDLQNKLNQHIKTEELIISDDNNCLDINAAENAVMTSTSQINTTECEIQQKSVLLTVSMKLEKVKGTKTLVETENMVKTKPLQSVKKKSRKTNG